MPTLTTEQVTTHTITLTEDELRALREAAGIALKAKPDSEHVDQWAAFVRLGKPATRSAARADFIDAHSNPGMIHTTP
ncbi:hypothetical protein AB0P17_15510 [Streptomyces sp. NPDC088124]|uniref:hypothetical protein n=1 Tax=Streptomyces sp. NPDC088124 TaxID=3154654 RepID=UPI00343A9BC8